MSTQTLEDPIDSVIAELESLVASALAGGDRIGYFAALYERVTRTIRSKNRDRLLRRRRSYGTLDVTFASRYLTAVAQYRRGDRAIAPAWKLAFDATSRHDLIVMQHLLLAMAPHIGIDLAMAAAATCPGPQIAALQSDFGKINAVLAAVVPTLIDELSSLSPYLHLVADLAENDEVSIIDFGLGNVRNSAWTAALALAAMDAAQQAAWVASETVAVLSIGRDVLSPGLIVGGVLDLVRSAEVADPRRIMEALNAGEPIADQKIDAANARRVSIPMRRAMAPSSPQAAPNEVYYFEVAPGRWAGTFAFQVTSWRRLWASSMTLKSKLIASAMGVFAHLFGAASMESELTPHADRGLAGEAVNRIRLYRSCFTLWRSNETYTLSPNGHGVRVDAHVSFGPIPGLFPEHDVYPASVYDGGMRNVYRIKLLGGRFLGNYEVQPDRTHVSSTLTNVWVIAHEALTKVTPTSP